MSSPASMKDSRGDITTENTTAKKVITKKRKRSTTTATMTTSTSSSPSLKGSTTTTTTSSSATTTMHHRLCRTMTLLDPLLQFLTRATGQSMVPLLTLRSTIPGNNKNTQNMMVSFEDLLALIRCGVLQIQPSPTPLNGNDPSSASSDMRLQEALQEQWEKGKQDCSDDNDDTATLPISFSIGFPHPDEQQRLHGSTKTAAKRRLAALKRQLKQEEQSNGQTSKVTTTTTSPTTTTTTRKDWTLPTGDDPEYQEEPILFGKGRDAQTALKDLLGLEHVNIQSTTDDATTTSGAAAAADSSILPTCVLPRQISYAGTHPSQEAMFVDDDNDWKVGVDPRIVNSLKQRKLYRHQGLAIASALENIPTLVCTGTGSGKSLCFLIPVLNAALLRGETSLLLFPTKALAQDQVVKLNAWLEDHTLHREIRAATLDGDTPHSQRVDIVTSCQIILTNPDTLHASILPNWKHLYSPLLSNLRYVVMDEAHMYTGVFGAHVCMIIARLYRLVSLQQNQLQQQQQGASTSDTNNSTSLCFLACSATLAHPEAHFRLLCSIPHEQTINVVKEDASPRAAKHFWVWNPPLLDMNRKSVGRVVAQRKKTSSNSKTNKSSSVAEHKKNTTGKENSQSIIQQQRRGQDDETHPTESITNPFTLKKVDDGPIDLSASPEDVADQEYTGSRSVQHRRHSADETALLLALAVSKGVRCIAFCKTRCLVEWVYERTLAALKQSPKTADLCRQVESYRGGYTKGERRLIEERLFNNQLLGVVGTSALELGVDIGGVDLTLHCGFPSSHENLIQQSGRAGRGANAKTSLAICVCFNSPMDQHLWRHPSSLLSRGFSAPLSMPIYPGLVQGHLLCAGQEYPLTGSLNVSVLQSSDKVVSQGLLSDMDLFGSPKVYEEALETLLSQGAVTSEKVAITSGNTGKATVYKTHPSIKNPWTQVSIRSIEPVSYQIVDTSHPRQGGRTDGIHYEGAVLDTIPYSRIFYHAFPGAIITHRGRRYKITCMTRPPAFGGKGFRGSVSLGAFAKPCNLGYYTRPLSSLSITVVKQLERVEAWGDAKSSKEPAAAKAKANTTETTPTVPDVTTLYSNKGPDPSFGSFAGCGIVTVKRNVHGYKKLSMVTREEISRSELSLPDMEFDSFAFWLDCHAEFLSPQLGEVAFGHGVHALSHALVAVAPLFVPCTVSDVHCDHSVYGPTRVTIFDARAGGSGICAQLWKCLFIPKGILEAAIGVLEECPSCSDDRNYDGGCPACLHAGECIKFNDFLSKSSGLVIGKHMLNCLKKTELYKKNEKAKKDTESEERNHRSDNDDGTTKVPRATIVSKDVTSPRQKKRERAMRKAQDISSARDRQVVVGRPSWPMDRSDGPRQENTGD